MWLLANHFVIGLQVESYRIGSHVALKCVSDHQLAAGGNKIQACGQFTTKMSLMSVDYITTLKTVSDKKRCSNMFWEKRIEGGRDAAPTEELQLMGQNSDSHISQHRWRATSLMWQTAQAVSPERWEHVKYANVCHVSGEVKMHHVCNFNDDATGRQVERPSTTYFRLHRRGNECRCSVIGLFARGHLRYFWTLGYVQTHPTR